MCLVPLRTEGKVQTSASLLSLSLTNVSSSINKFIPYLAAGLKHSLQDCGMTSTQKLHESATDGLLRFELRTSSAQMEGNVNMEAYEKKLYA